MTTVPKKKSIIHRKQTRQNPAIRPRTLPYLRYQRGTTRRTDRRGPARTLIQRFIYRFAPSPYPAINHGESLANGVEWSGGVSRSVRYTHMVMGKRKQLRPDWTGSRPASIRSATLLGAIFQFVCILGVFRRGALWDTV